MSSWWDSIAYATSGALYYAGLSGEVEQPPFDCAWPLKPYSKDAAAEMLLRHKKQYEDLLNAKDWELMNFKDAEGGDLHLMTKPGVGRYHMIKASFSVPNSTPEKMADIISNDDFEVRKSYSADCTGLKVLEKPTANSKVMHVTYTAPSPVVGRDFVFLLGRETNADGSVDLWGCSVDTDLCKDGETGLVRGACIWGWHLVGTTDSIFAQYVSCFDPRGWAPTFLVSWLKSAASNEMIALRAVAAGKKAKLETSTLQDLGVTEDQVKQELAELEKKKKEAEAKEAQ